MVETGLHCLPAGDGAGVLHPQTWLPTPLYLLSWMLTLLVVIYLPTHWALRCWLAPQSASAEAGVAPSARLTWQQA